MNKNTLWTIVGVVVAVFIAWVLVDLLLKAFWLVARLGIVAVVALVVFLLIRMLFSSSDEKE